MNKYRNTDKDIHSRMYHFIVDCFRDVVKKIPNTVANTRIIDQISGSLTSMGANDQEADAALTRKDFIAKYTIVRKEAKETEYWLSLIRDVGLISSEVISPHVDECVEIRKIVSSIMENSRR
jgi:four helix bundle protein